jgi:UDP-GlcNAc:undecaprenyl-phosphate GlcNAc-1-phosphate transferase
MANVYLLNEIFVAFFVAMILALVLIPLLSWGANRVSLVDRPDKNRKLHLDAIPLVGGIAIFFATILALAIMFAVRFGWFGSWDGWSNTFILTSTDWLELGALLLGSLILLVVGILDDRIGLRGRQKLLGQLVACTVIIACGYQVTSIDFKGWLFNFTINFGSFAALASILWMLAAINSINLLDGADGFAGTIGAVMGIAFCIMALATGHVVDAAVFAAFSGAILAFLRFNWPPAKVYLGDAGSMLIGFVIGALAIRCTLKQATAYAFLGPLALLSIPFLDTAAAIIRRRLTGRSIYSVDRAHLHHTLAGRGFGPRASLLLIGLLCALTAAGGTLSVITKQSEFAVIAIAIVMLFLVTNRLFGIAELKLIFSRLGRLLNSFNALRPAGPNHHASCIQLQGRRDWQLIWLNIREFSEKFDFKTVKLHLHLPWLHEIFHARYDRARADLPEYVQEWYFVMPLCVEDRLVGEVEVVALQQPDVLPHETLRRLMEMLADLEPQFVEIIRSEIPDITKVEVVETIPSVAAMASASGTESHSSGTIRTVWRRRRKRDRTFGG